LSLRSTIHSASLRATGSVIDRSATSATTSLPLRVASITCLTRAMSAAEVAAVGAMEKGPEAGRAIGLKVALAAKRPPRRPTLAWANELRPTRLLVPSAPGWSDKGIAAGAATRTAGFGRGSGTRAAVFEVCFAATLCGSLALEAVLVEVLAVVLAAVFAPGLAASLWAGLAAAFAAAAGASLAAGTVSGAATATLGP
jgi:hypothetical protein